MIYNPNSLFLGFTYGSSHLISFSACGNKLNIKIITQKYDTKCLTWFDRCGLHPPNWRSIIVESITKHFFWSILLHSSLIEAESWTSMALLNPFFEDDFHSFHVSPKASLHVSYLGLIFQSLLLVSSTRHLGAHIFFFTR